MSPAVIEVMRGFIERVAQAPIELGPPETIEEAQVLFSSVEKLAKSARLVMLLIETDGVPKQ